MRLFTSFWPIKLCNPNSNRISGQERLGVSLKQDLTHSGFRDLVCRENTDTVSTPVGLAKNYVRRSHSIKLIFSPCVSFRTRSTENDPGECSLSARTRRGHFRRNSYKKRHELKSQQSLVLAEDIAIPRSLRE